MSKNANLIHSLDAQALNKMGRMYPELRRTEDHHPIIRQKLGRELKSENHTKIEYQLRSKNGRIVMGFDGEEHARLEASERGLNLFRVTTISEKL